MMAHYLQDADANVSYRLYAYFPNKEPGTTHPTSVAELKEILATKNRNLKKLVDAVKDKLDCKDFRSRLVLEFGLPFDQLKQDVCSALRDGGLPDNRIDVLFYPNAIDLVSTLSIQHSDADRRITRLELLRRLKKIDKTAISKWTLALKSHDDILKERRRQVALHLRTNSRLRYFLISSSVLDDFDEKIVPFIRDYVARYHYKKTHICTPLFCLDCPQKTFDDIRLRLHHRGLRLCDGFVGAYFDIDRFFRDPLCTYPKNRPNREFDIRLLHFNGRYDVLNTEKCDDLFLVGNEAHKDLDTQDVNVEHFVVGSSDHLSFILGLSNAYQ
jgi:hypothetical protein